MADDHRAEKVNDISSPCIGICEMDQSLGLCSGCYRTIDEIIDWTMLSATEKRRVIDDAATRKSSMQDSG